MQDDDAQREILNLIIEALKSGESAPTTRELARQSRPTRVESNVHSLLSKLEERGYIVRDTDDIGRAIPRAIRLRGTPKTRPVPLLGRIAAGSPIPVIGEDVLEYMMLPVDRVRAGEAFLLRVVGDSMTGDGILDGDFVVVASDLDPGEDEIAVVIEGEEATVKRVKREPDGFLLLSSNPDFEPRFVHSSDGPFIQGRVIGVIRWLP